MDFTEVLPTEVVEHILSYLSGEELGRACLVSARWRYLAAGEQLWRRIVHRGNHLLPITHPPQGAGKWKEAYGRVAGCCRNWAKNRRWETRLGGRVQSWAFLDDGSLLVVALEEGVFLYDTNLHQESPVQKVVDKSVDSVKASRLILVLELDSVFLCYRLEGGKLGSEVRVEEEWIAGEGAEREVLAYPVDAASVIFQYYSKSMFWVLLSLLTGARVWRIEHDRTYYPTWFLHSSGLYVLPRPQEMFCYDTETGKERTRKVLRTALTVEEVKVFRSYFLEDYHVLIHKRLLLFSSEAGSEPWKFARKCHEFLNDLGIKHEAERILYIDEDVRTVEISTGRVLWSVPRPRQEHSASYIVCHRFLLLATPVSSSPITLLDLATGAVVQEFQVPGMALSTANDKICLFAPDPSDLVEGSKLYVYTRGVSQ